MAAQNAEYAKLRKEYLALYPVCEVEECQAASTEVHHAAGREGDRLLDVNYFVALCHDCHVRITEHSAQAIEDGHSIKRSEAKLF